ncbi:transglycosylase associated protein [Pacificibacter maritimus]|uniref:Transglycosylase associated protein n=1 Tax=Pacificibacter maritimus TaxID=762213 RepID=A0A3N4UR99_9RHOB|nr:GlsB/YeaQ/YmgE family stress response membrane protein [Pacificibacter maritimus]RPE63214.1 transglycosylase associated protein [Pacificibacter maritimus]
MPIVLLIILGAAAGFIATRIMRVDTSIVLTVAIGIAGALVGGLVLRTISVLTGALGGFIGALLGAMILIWFWQKLKGKD